MNFIYPVSRYLKITQGYWSGHLGIDFGWNDDGGGARIAQFLKDDATVGVKAVIERVGRSRRSG